MPNKRIVFILGGCFFLGVLSGLVLGGLGLGVLSLLMGTNENGSGQSPRRSITLTIEPSYRDKFFDQMRKYGAKHHFKTSIDASNPNGVEFLISMYGDDVQVIADNPFDPREYELSFYDAQRQHPVSEAVLDSLVDDLSNFMAAVPNSNFTITNP